MNEEVAKLKTKTWKNENIDISDHIMIDITCRKNREKKSREKCRKKNGT